MIDFAQKGFSFFWQLNLVRIESLGLGFVSKNILASSALFHTFIVAQTQVYDLNIAHTRENPPSNQTISEFFAK